MAQTGNKKKKAAKSSINENKDMCPKCKTNVEEERLWCEMCNNCFHIECLNINKDQYSFITANKDVYFVCKTCKYKDKKTENITSGTNNSDFNEMILALMEKMNQVVESNDILVKTNIELEKRVKILENDCTTNSDSNKMISSLMVKMNQVVESNEKLVKSNIELEKRVKILEEKEMSFKSNCEEQPKNIVETNINDLVEDKIQEAMREAKEIESRKLNLILVNVKETEVKHKDQEVVENIIKKVIPDEEVKIDQVLRLGEKNKNRARLLRIKVQNTEIKRKILRNSNKLNEDKVTDPKKKIYINEDLTKTQREINKTLRDQLKAMPTEERNKYTIRSNKIVARKVDMNEEK